jgi:hypothetical protein
MEHVRVQDGLALVDEVDKTAHATGTGEVVFLAGAFVLQADLHAVVQETQFRNRLLRIS